MVAMRYCRAALLAIAAGFLAMPQAHAADPVIFTIPAESGYGIGECLQPGSACGRVMADSYCEAQGYGKAIAFGPADDVTGSTPPSPAPSTPVIKAAAGAEVIRCGE